MTIAFYLMVSVGF